MGSPSGDSGTAPNGVPLGPNISPNGSPTDLTTTTTTTTTTTVPPVQCESGADCQNNAGCFADEVAIINGDGSFPTAGDCIHYKDVLCNVDTEVNCFEDSEEWGV